jgi:hypothetical protein
LRSFSERKNAETGNEYQGDGFARFMITFQRRHKAGTGRLKEVLAPLHDASGRKGGACGAERLPIRERPRKRGMDYPAFFFDRSKGFGKNFDVGCSCRFCKKDTFKEKNGVDMILFIAFSPVFSRKALL